MVHRLDAVAKDRGNDQRGHGQHQHGGIHPSVAPVKLLGAVLQTAHEHAQAQYQQDVAHDRAGQRGSYQFEHLLVDGRVQQSLADGHDGDDQLRRVAQRGIEQSTQARARVDGQRLGGRAHQPRQGDHGQAGRSKDNQRVPTGEFSYDSQDNKDQ